jgi:LPS O-antigen subunit length determinant protein (WzzB/FepE family)
MITLKIENENVEKIFLDEFNSNKEKFLEFIQNSYDKMKSANHQDSLNTNLSNAQETSMAKTWDNDADEAWNEL